jgi:RimJ/RimL family protein N-acetyltransferase
MPLDLTGVDLPTLEMRTARLVLRPFRPDDEEAVLAACQDPEILRWTVRLPDPYTRADAAAWVRDIAPAARADGTGLQCAVEADGELVGAAGLELGTAVEVGYWIAASARRRGYATEATRALADWALAHGAEQVRLRTAVGNTGSQAVAEAAGFTRREVVRRGLTHLDGTREDAVLFVREL